MDKVVQGEPTKGVNYREQSGCHNCRHVHASDWHGYETEYHCALGSPPPHFDASERFTSADLEAWSTWADTREVRPFGICDAHEANFGSIHFDILVQVKP